MASPLHFSHATSANRVHSLHCNISLSLHDLKLTDYNKINRWKMTRFKRDFQGFSSRQSYLRCKADKPKKNTLELSTWLWLSKTCSRNRCPSKWNQMKMIVILFITGKLKHVQLEQFKGQCRPIRFQRVCCWLLSKHAQNYVDVYTANRTALADCRDAITRQSTTTANRR